MNLISAVADMRAEREGMAGTIGLVPTMGYLHEGHLSLVRRAIQNNEHVIVSIFVNPTQFGPHEDLDRYPRDLTRDLELLESAHSALGTQHSALVFSPTVEEMYPPGFDDWVEVRGPLTERLEGAHRPGHFRGVATVVARLFRIVQPRRAYFGQKDAQQLRVIRRMVQEQRLPVEIVPMPTVREPDGLALSSRNVYLSSEERTSALAIPRSLALARRLVMAEGVTDAQAVRTSIHSQLTTHNSRLVPDYVSVSGEQTFEELDTIDCPALILIAASVGTTRLIDNTIVAPTGIPTPGEVEPLMSADAASLPKLTTDN